MKRQQGASSNVAYTTEELFNMGKAQFTKIVSAFEHSMAGSAQEKLRERSDLEAMVEQIEQETLQDQAHALLQAWREAESAGNMLEQQGFATSAAEVRAVCSVAKAAVEKILSPETIEAQAKWSVDCEVWSVRFGVWRKQWEVWSAECEVWSLDSEECSVQCEVWSVEGRTRSG